MTNHKSIFKSASIISAFTVISRITGFFRDILIANVFGTGISAQAFFVAFKIPNVLRSVTGEGAGNAAFVPVFSEYLARKGRPDFLKLVNTLLVLLLGVSFIILFVGMFLAPRIVSLIAPGFLQDPGKFELTVSLTRLLFPYLVLITISAYLMSAANSLKSFAVPASSSIVFNLVLIVFIFLISRSAGMNQIYGLGAGVLVAGAAQVLIQLPSLAKKGIDFRRGGFYRHPFAQEAVRKVGNLILPRLVGVSIYQFSIFIDTIFASLAFLVGEGAVAAIYYANRIIYFPFSVFGVALSVAALPQMSTSSANKDLGELKATLGFCLKSVFLGIIPLTVGILLFATPLVRVIFQRGSFDAYSTAITSNAVFFYAFGLISYVGVRFLSHAFYALQDTLTPVKTSASALLANILLNSLFIFIFKWGISGLALASSLSATFNFLILYLIIKKRIGFTFGPLLRQLLIKAAIASLVMGGFVFWVWEARFSTDPTILKMLFIFCLGGAIYAAFLWLLKVRELKELLLWLKKK